MFLLIGVLFFLSIDNDEDNGHKKQETAEQGIDKESSYILLSLKEERSCAFRKQSCNNRFLFAFLKTCIQVNFAVSELMCDLLKMRRRTSFN